MAKRDNQYSAHLAVKHGILKNVRRAGLVSPELLAVLSRYVEDFERPKFWTSYWEKNKAQILRLEREYGSGK